MLSKRDNQLYFLGLKGYSSTTFEDINLFFTWGNGGCISLDIAIERIAEDNTNLSKIPFQGSFPDYGQHFSRWSLPKIIEFMKTYLTLVRTTLDPTTCRREANRRLILDVIFLVISLLIGRAMSCEHLITKNDCDVQNRTGNGPLDFYLKSFLSNYYYSRFTILGEISALQFFNTTDGKQ